MKPQDKRPVIQVQKQGPHISIASALRAASPNSIVSITQGIYFERLVLTKPVKLQPSSPEEIVIIISDSSPTITVDLDGQVELEGLLIAHTGCSEEDKYMFKSVRMERLNSFNPSKNYFHLNFKTITIIKI